MITDTSENKHILKRITKHKINDDKTENSKKPHKENPTQSLKSKYLSHTDKALIEEGVFHSQKKFDSLEEFVKKDDLHEYNHIVTKEVRLHLAEERGDFAGVDDDDNIMAYIRHKVNGIVRSQVAALDEDFRSRRLSGKK